MTNYPHSDLKEDFTHGGMIGREQVVNFTFPDRYKKDVYNMTHRHFAEDLYEAIQKSIHPVVVEIFEDVERSGEFTETIRLRARLTPVESRHVVMEHLDHHYAYPASMSHYKIYKKLNKILNFLKIK